MRTCTHPALAQLRRAVVQCRAFDCGFFSFVAVGNIELRARAMCVCEHARVAWVGNCIIPLPFISALCRPPPKPECALICRWGPGFHAATRSLVFRSHWILRLSSGGVFVLLAVVVTRGKLVSLDEYKHASKFEECQCHFLVMRDVAAAGCMKLVLSDWCQIGGSIVMDIDEALAAKFSATILFAMTRRVFDSHVF